LKNPLWVTQKKTLQNISVAFEMFDRDRERDVAITQVDLTHHPDCHPQILIARVSLYMNEKY
jgi:hypothetical protein